MPPWLIIWSARFSSGERFRKATPEEMRWFSAYFVLLPPVCGVAGLLGHRILDTGGYWTIVLYVAVWVVIIWVATKLWARFIPAKASWILGAIEWAGLFCLALTGRLS